MTSHGGASAETVAQSDPNLLEATVSQGHTYHYYPQNAGSVTASWPAQSSESQITQNGSYSNVSYHYNPHKEVHSTNAQEGANIASISYVPPTSQHYNPHKDVHSTNVQDGANSASISYLPPTSQAEITSQAYPTNSTYSASASSYGYNNTGYSGYYNAYQQPPPQSYSQPAVGYQSQNTGAPYQPISSFQNTGSYAGTPSYSSTYYNPGHYQTYGGYTENGYNPGHYQGNFSNYNEQPQQHPTYNQDSGSAYSSSSVAPTAGNYQHQNKQWADYYSPTEVTCAPGTENKTVTSTSTLTCPIPGAPAGYTPPVSQPQEPYIPWKPDSVSSTSAVQTGVAVGTHDSYWQPGSQGYPNPANYQQPHSANSSFVGVQEWQQSAGPHGPLPTFNGANQVTAITHQPLQPLQSTDTRRASKLQIPTNPRIASNIAIGLTKSDKDSSPAIASVKPAYISVSLPKPSEKTPSSHGSDTDRKPGVFPPSLRGYVERALARCKGEKQLVASQEIMKEMITKATADGTLHSHDWDMEPLFPLPDAANNESLGEADISSLAKLKRSPTRRTKSRWEPMPEEKLVENAASTSHNSMKFAGWAHFNGRDKKFSGAKSESKGSGNSKFSFYEPANHSKSAQRPFKRQRFGKYNPEIDNASSDSDQEKGLTAYYSGAMALASSPEEKKKRESRSKRFEKVNGQREQVDNNRVKSAGIGNTYSRRAAAFVLSKTFDDNSPGAVEDFDLDALTVKGTCQEIEKRYLRLTSAPDPATVRPEEVLQKALLMVQNSQKNYLYKCDQLKSIRQDLTVQRIRNELTVKVYETHARLALEFGDLPEFNQCQSQLKFLYGEGIAGCHMEFSAYTLLSVILHSNYNRRELLSSMARLSDEVRRDEAVKHALAVRQAVNAGNYIVFFRLYKSAPNLNTCLMDLYVEKIRFQAVQCISKAYRPTVPVAHIAHALGFSSLATIDEGEERGVDGLEDCIEWLKAHGACLVSETNGDVQLDAKASSSSLYMPEPEDAVAHGDANLAVNDFFTRAST